MRYGTSNGPNAARRARHDGAAVEPAAQLHDRPDGGRAGGPGGRPARRRVGGRGDRDRRRRELFVTHFDVAEILAGSEAVGPSARTGGRGRRAARGRGDRPDARRQGCAGPDTGGGAGGAAADPRSVCGHGRSDKVGWPRSTGWPWAVAASSRWPATCAT